MTSLGIWLRGSAIVSDHFIAVFYTGLGSSLFLAVVLFGIQFIKSMIFVLNSNNLKYKNEDDNTLILYINYSVL